MTDTSVLVADEQRLFAEALGLALATQPGLKVVGVHYGSGHEAVLGAIGAVPDVVLFDYWMPEIRGPAAARYLRSWVPGAHVVLLSWLHGPHHTQEARDAGALGLVPKGIGLCDLVETVRAARWGGPLFHADGSTRRLDPVPSGHQPNGNWERFTSLTPRELEVLSLLTQAHPAKQVAERLGISPGNVRNHIQSILKKTNTTSKHEAIVLARQAGLVHDIATWPEA